MRNGSDQCPQTPPTGQEDRNSADRPKSGLRRDLVLIGLKCALLGTIVGAIGIGIFLIPLSNHHNYLLADKDKRTLLEGAASPKIVLVGGSNLALSVDSGLIEARLGQRVINMGLSCFLGLEYMISEVEPSLRRGDTVVLVPEYELLSSGFVKPLTILNLLDLDHTSGTYMAASSWPVIARHIPAYLTKKLHWIVHWHGLTAPPGSPPPYVREAFDHRGDIRDAMRTRLEDVAPATKIGKVEIGQAELCEPSKLLLSGFVARSRARGVSVLVSFPPIPENEFHRQPVAFWRIESQLRTVLGTCVISRPVDYVFPEREFLDFVYHLRVSAKRLRTERLLADIRQHQGIT
jgi:hypothetical protein